MGNKNANYLEIPLTYSTHQIDRRKLLHHTQTNSILIQHHPLLTESHHTTQITPVWKEPREHTCKPSACTAIQQKTHERELSSKESKPVLQ